MSRNTFKINGGIEIGQLASPPSNPVNGLVYYDSATNEFKIYKNGAFKVITDQAQLDDAIASIGAETSRAQGAESTLQSNINSEASTRSGADITLQGNISAEASTRSGADITLQSNITAEALARANADAALQNAINAVGTALQWRPGAIAATGDAGLAAAPNDTALATLLPFSDDDAPLMVIGDFAAGQYLVSKAGASSKVFSIYDDAGTLKVTTLGVTPLASGHVLLVENDLPDSPSSQEGMAIYSFNGSDLIKVGDVDWSVATGIDLSGSFTPTTGTVLAGDSLELAIAKIVGNLDAEYYRAYAAETLLQTNLDNEGIARGAAQDILQDNIDAEALTRSNADTTLQDNIDTETGLRISADSTLQSNINSEASTRSNNDITLQDNIDAEQARAIAAENLKLENVSEDTSPSLGGDLDIGSYTLIQGATGIKRGSSNSNFIAEQYIHSTSLLASQVNTVITGLTFAHATTEGLEITYKIKQATSNNVRLGTLRVVTNGTDVAIVDTSAETADVGISFAAAINGSNVEIKYSSSPNACTMRADVKRILA